MYNPEAAEANKAELYEAYFRPLGRLAGEAMMDPITSGGIDLMYRSAYARALESEGPEFAGAAGVLGVADACGVISAHVAGQLIEQEPDLLLWLRSNADAMYLSADGNGPEVMTDASMLEALKDKAYRNTLLGFGRILLWNAGVSRYMQQTLPEEYEQGGLWPALDRSCGTVNRLAAMVDEEENAIVGSVVTHIGGDIKRFQAWGAIPNVMLGTAYVDPKYIRHHGKPGGRVMTLDVPASRTQANRQGCPMLQKPDHLMGLVPQIRMAQHAYMMAFHGIATKYYIKASGYTKYATRELRMAA